MSFTDLGMRGLVMSLVLVLLGACAHGDHGDDRGLAKVETGDMEGTKYTYRSKTYFMHQPTLKALDEAKKRNVTTVINLRTNEEMNNVEYPAADEAKKRGLNYYQFPLDSQKPLSKEVLAQIEAAYMLHHTKGEGVIVHCASGQRAAAWFAYHIRNTHGATADQALMAASAVGLTNSRLSEDVRTVIQ